MTLRAPGRNTQPLVTGATVALVVLTLVNLLNYLDRYVLSAILPLVEESFDLNDSQSGFLGSLFILVYLAASPFAGYLGDRRARKYLVSGGVFLWSLATIGSGLASNYEQLLWMRALVGVGEAGYATVAPSMIADLYSKKRLGRMLAIFYMAIPIGSALGYVVGGSVGARFGWQWAFFVAGAPGLVMAIIAALVPEPRRGSQDGEESAVAPPPLTAVRQIFLNRVWWYDTVGTTLMTFTAGGLAFWMPTYLVRHQGMSTEAAATTLGLLLVGAGLIGTPLGGWPGDRASRSKEGGHLKVCAVALFLAAPLIAVIPMIPTTSVVLVAAFGSLFLLATTVGPINAVLVGCVPAALRSTAVAMNLLLVHLLGDALSPSLIGWISDRSNLGYAVALSAGPVLMGGVVLALGAASVNRSQQGLRPLV
jgi:MFS family permease